VSNRRPTLTDLQGATRDIHASWIGGSLTSARARTCATRHATGTCRGSTRAQELVRALGPHHVVVVDDVLGCRVGVPVADRKPDLGPGAVTCRRQDDVLLQHAGIGEDSRAGLEDVQPVDRHDPQQVSPEVLEIRPVRARARGDGYELAVRLERGRAEREERRTEGSGCRSRSAASPPAATTGRQASRTAGS
jgi:hypothetical protein